MDLTYRRYADADADDLVAFLTGDTWPFHGSPVVDAERARQWAAEGRFGNAETESFWIDGDGEPLGLVRLMDLGDSTPVFDLRIRSRYRGRGIGGHALTWLTEHLFTALPRIRRIEGTTRRDNAAMRRTFRRCGYVQEAHYREGWPSADGTVHDAVGYAILRRDWAAGTTTAPAWDDERTTEG
ncbi:GNAT family N-acetyltransferase [Streptomyces sp. NBC_01367]|uniref:GNAT family N-acetyltransferase n=1 Tax=Streptomyces sp. NBC_01367 TaxID=2903841 RepID=UPI00324B053E